MTGRLSDLTLLAEPHVSPSGDVPSWVWDFVAAGAAPVQRTPWHRRGEFSARRWLGPHFGLWSLRKVGGVLELDAEGFEDLCSRAYQTLEEAIDPLGPRFPVRLWNFVPEILAPLGDVAHRYMVFNAGRFRAFERWLGADAFACRLATASGVGHREDELVLHCLASVEPGRPVENPRQIAAWRYSPRYGPLPPCFARATSIQDHAGRPWLLVGGTASVCGEDSCHIGDLPLQLDETLRNLAAVFAAAHQLPTDTPPAELDPAGVAKCLEAYRHLRVYVVRPADRPYLEQELRRRFPPGTVLELIDAELCRPDLLVEIEGLAELA